MKCLYCKGKGYEPIEGGRKARCPDCRGTGQEQPPEEPSQMTDHESTIADLRDQLATAEAERDQWKANHDNQAALKRTLMDRPDLRDRAKSMQALIFRAESAEARLRAVTEAAEQTLERITSDLALSPSMEKRLIRPLRAAIDAAKSAPESEEISLP